MSKKSEFNQEFGTGGTVYCTCDNCGKTIQYKFKEKPFKTCIEKMKNKGWFTRKLGDNWYDFCSDKCFEEFR